MTNLSTTARLATTAVAGLAGYAAVGIYTILAGPVEGYLDMATVMLLFTVVYVPGVFGARWMLRTFAVAGASDAASARR